VKKGQLLAEIDTPEVDQQLQQSRSNLATAEANLKLAEITKTRYQGLLKTNAVAQQDVDNAVGTYNANQATVEAMKANVKQLETLQSFEKIYAPFDGIVTVRNVDVGDLINSVAPQARGPTSSISRSLGNCAFMSTYRRSTHKLPRRADGRVDTCGISRAALPREAGTHRQCHQLRNPHLAGGS